MNDGEKVELILAKFKSDFFTLQEAKEKILKLMEVINNGK